MNCMETRPLLSSYLDGAITGKQMIDAREHLEHCAECRREFAALKRTQQMVSALGRKQAPDHLALQIRVAVSQKLAKSRRPLWSGFAAKLEHVGNAFLMPATAGMFSAVIFFGLLIGYFAVPSQLEASGSDVPTMLYTPPVLKFSPFEIDMSTISGDSIVIEAYVDATGRVQDYRILTGPSDVNAYLPQLNNMLIFTVYSPATAFGQPTTGKALLSFSKINVKG